MGLKIVRYYLIMKKGLILAVKGIIFDLDGTLVDTLDDLTDSMNAALTQVGCPKRSRQQCREMIGNGLHKFAERALEPEHLDLTEQLLVRMVSYYRDHCLLKTHAYPGIKETVSKLSAKGIRLSVLTNKNQAPAEVITCHFFGTETFDPIVGAAEGRTPKPDPKTTLDIIAGWGLSREEVLFVGDSETDIQAAKNAGVHSIGCEWGFRSKDTLCQAGVDFLIQQPRQILDLVT